MRPGRLKTFFKKLYKSLIIRKSCKFHHFLNFYQLYHKIWYFYTLFEILCVLLCNWCRAACPKRCKNRVILMFFTFYFIIFDFIVNLLNFKNNSYFYFKNPERANLNYFFYFMHKILIFIRIYVNLHILSSFYVFL